MSHTASGVGLQPRRSVWPPTLCVLAILGTVSLYQILFSLMPSELMFRFGDVPLVGLDGAGMAFMFAGTIEGLSRARDNSRLIGPAQHESVWPFALLATVGPGVAAALYLLVTRLDIYYGAVPFAHTAFHVLAVLAMLVLGVGVAVIRSGVRGHIVGGPRRTGTNGLAVAAFTMVFVFPPLGILFGHLAHAQMRHTGEGGAGFAMAALILGYLGLATTVAVLVVYLTVFRYLSR